MFLNYSYILVNRSLFMRKGVQNPSREHVEKLIAALENGTDGLAFSSGMAAIAARSSLYRYFRFAVN